MPTTIEVDNPSHEVDCWIQELADANEYIQAFVKRFPSFIVNTMKNHVGQNIIPSRRLMRYHPDRRDVSEAESIQVICCKGSLVC